MNCVATTSQDLLSCGQGVTPGLATTFHYALKRQLTDAPKRPLKVANMTLAAAITAAADSEYTFVTGGKFSKIEGVIEISYEGPMDGLKRSKMFRPKLIVKLPLTVDVEGFLELFKNEEMIIVFKDADVTRRQLGDMDFPAYLVNGDPVINDTEKSITIAFEAGPHPALVLPDTIAIPLAPAV